MSWKLRSDPGGFQIRWSKEAARRYRTAGHWRDTTLADIARQAVRDDPDRVLLIEGATKLTRGQAWEQALRLAGFFASRGLRPGDVISFQLPNWLEAAVIALAARLAGLVVNPIPPIYREAELAYILKDCGAKLLFLPRVFRKFDHRAAIVKLRAELPALADVVIVRGGGTGDLCWESVIAGEALPERQLPRVDPAAVMMVMYTSGTTGRPKGVLFAHHNFDYRVRAMGEVWGIGPEDVIFMPSPVSHITGAFWAFDMPWVQGATSVLIDVWTAQEGIRAIEHNRCTVSGGATPFLQQLVESARLQTEALGSLRLFFCGGTTVSPELILQASARFPHCLFFRVYGSTEMPTTTVGINRAEQARMGAETDGEVLAPTEVRIVDPAAGDAPVAAGQEGEILARGPEQFVGYLHPEDNDGCFDSDGFFRTGDLGRIVHGNYLQITGRKKDIVIRSGENISPKEIEDILFAHPAVAEVAIVAMPSAQTGEKGCAFVVLRQGEDIDLGEIRRYLEAAGLSRQKFPEHLVLLDELPHVPSGKVRKDVLRQRAREIAAAQDM